MLERLNKLANESAVSSQEDKLFIRETSKALGVKFNYRNNCQNCYHDQVFVLIRKIDSMKKEFEVAGNGVIKAEKCRYKLNPELKIDVIHRDVRINAENLTDEKAEMLIKDGFHRWFSKIPK